MHASLYAMLILAASAVAPVLSVPIGYVVLLLHLAISADLFVAFAAALMLLHVVLHLPHVTLGIRITRTRRISRPGTGTGMRRNAALRAPQTSNLLRLGLSTKDLTARDVDGADAP